ncbi:tetratricopeptide repeat protein [bacterium]|nr:tetratricopeptide repeat protein [bacterium]
MNARTVAPLGLIVIVALAVSGCVAGKTSAPAVDSSAELRAQMEQMQRTLANMNLRMEELNNSVALLQDTAKANRDSIRKMRSEMDTPTIYIGETTPVAPATESAPLPSGGPTQDFGSAAGEGYVPGAAVSSSPPSLAGAPVVIPPAQGGDADRPSSEDGLSVARGHHRAGQYGLAAYELGRYLAAPRSTNDAAAARMLLAESYERLGDHAQASRHYGLVLSSGAGSYAPQARYRLAECAVALGQKVKARELFKSVVSLHPGTDEARRASEKLAQLESPEEDAR